jgi:PAS domain S-box-containing protein
VIGERRITTLRQLASELAAANTENMVLAAVERQFGANPKDLPFTLTYLFDREESGRARLVCSTGITERHPAAPETIQPGAPGELWPASEILTYSLPITVDLSGMRTTPALPTGNWDKTPQQAVLVPIKQQGQERPAGFLVAALNPYRPYDATYVGFIDLLAGQLAAAIANARAYEGERERAEALAELDRTKTAFFSNVSHEFRTPLTLLLGPVEDILAKPEGDLQPENRELLAVVHRNGLRLQRLVNTLLDFSRIESGRAQASYEPTDLASFTLDLASSFRSAMERAGLTFTLKCSPLSAPVYVDREMWEKVVLNLVSNAFKYTFSGSVSVELDERDGQAELSVADTGTGIPEHELPRLFERFHRVQGARGRTHEGTGIGLALVQELVKLHGGSVSAVSSVGKGSVFTVSIPFGTARLPAGRVEARRDISSTALHSDAYVEEAVRWLPEEQQDRATQGASFLIADGNAQKATQMESDAAPLFQRRSRVLLADDNADMREYVRRLLSAHYEVTAVSNGEEALAAAAANPPDLVLTDVMMPQLNGFGLLKALRGQPEAKTVPVILLSARAGEESRIEGLDAGADDYLVKPFTARELLARVAAHLGLSRMRQEAAEALREGEDRFRKAFAEAPVGMVLTGAEGQIIEANHAFLDMVGYTLDELISHDSGRFTHPDDIAPTRLFFESLRRHDQTTAVLKKRYIRRDGQLVWARASATMRHGAKGEPEQLVAIIEDITAQVEAEEELRKHEQRLEEDRRRWRELLLQTPAAIAVLRGPSHMFEWVNSDYVRLVGRPAEALVGKTVRHALPEVEGQVYIDLLNSVYRTGEPYFGREALARLDVRGNGVLQDLYLNFVYVATKDADGQIDGIFVHATDVTDMVRARQRIEESEERFRTMANAAPVLIWVAGPDKLYTWLNEPWLRFTGRTMEQELGNGWTETVHPQDLQRWISLYTASFDAREQFSTEYRLKRNDGEWRWVLDHGVPRYGPTGEFLGYIGSCFDINDRREAEVALRKTNRELEEFAYVSSHDLQEPLRMVNIYTQLLVRRFAKDDGDAQQYAAFIQNGVARMEELLRDLLTFSRTIQSENSPITEADLSASLSRALSVLNVRIEEEGALVTAGPLPSVRGDEAQLAQVFQNLISNSLKYRRLDVSPEIRISAESHDNHWTISVRDNGIGFDPQYAERIFGLFKRLHKDAYPGTGLGLAICQRIVERYNGRMWAEGRPGEGSTFYFTFPQHDAETDRPS